MKVLVNRVIGLQLLDMKKVIEEVTNLNDEYAMIGDSLYIDSSVTLESVPSSAQHVLKFDTEESNNGAGWGFIFGCKNFKEIVEKIAEDKGVDYEYFNPEIICIEYVTDAHFKAGKMDQPDKYFCSIHDDLDELAENLGWIRFKKEGMKVWFDEILLLVESAAQPSCDALYTKDGFYTTEEYQKLMDENEFDKDILKLNPPLYKVVGWVETKEEAEEWLMSEAE